MKETMTSQKFHIHLNGVKAVSVVIPSSDGITTKTTLTPFQYKWNFCEVIVSFIILKFKDVTEETFQWRLFFSCDLYGRVR